MTEQIIQVTESNQSLLYGYCARYGGEHDSSFLPGRDFEISEDHPSYLLIEEDQVIGAVCLMCTERYTRIGKARFSIFHAIQPVQRHYARLLEAIHSHCTGLRSVYLFIPEEKVETGKILAQLGFQIERYSFILERGGPPLPDPVFPEGVSLQPLTRQDQEGICQFVDCLNQEFRDLAGHTPSSPADIESWFEDQSYLEGGLCLLKEGREAIGTIALMRDLDNPQAGEIMAFGLLAEQRGRSLGRNLFRYGFNFLIDRGLAPVVLSVNGENHNAIRLYESEGFQLIETVVCFHLKLEE